MSEIDEILDYLEYISQQKRSVSLVNTYHGVSVSVEVNIQEILRRRRDVVVVTQFGQNLSLLPATQILVHSDLFPRPIQARVASVDIHHRTAVLRNFSYFSSAQEGRKETRVQPKSELSATITIGEKDERTGVISDISGEGISLILKSKSIDLVQIFLPDTSVRIVFNLPVSNQMDPVNVSLPAKVSYINAIDPAGDFRIGFMTYPQEHQKAILRRYIFDRQTEIFSDVGEDQQA
jgi:hypothetical protein